MPIAAGPFTKAHSMPAGGWAHQMKGAGSPQLYRTLLFAAATKPAQRGIVHRCL